MSAPLRLVVSVDTEEEGLWSGAYRRTGNTCENIRGVPRFQTLCDDLGVRPTYLVTAPVVQDAEASAILAEILGEERCEIGTHVHPWCNPPANDLDASESYLCNLPSDVQEAKIEWLTDAIERRFDVRPTSFRAGRYGLGTDGAAALAKLGYEVDSSVTPFVDHSPGPDFTDAPWRPYAVGRQLTSRGDGPLQELPVTVGFNRKPFERAMRLTKAVRRTPWRHMKVEGVADAVGLLSRVRFSPEQADAKTLCRLADLAADQDAGVLVLMFHSTSLAAGLSPYVPDEAALDRFLGRIEAVVTHCVDQLGAEPATLTEAARALRPALIGHEKATV